MEIAAKNISLNCKEWFLKAPKPFTTKRDVKWERLGWIAAGVLILLILLILILPAETIEQTVFHEKVNASGGSSGNGMENNPTQDTVRQFEEAQVGSRSVHGSLDHLYADTGGRSLAAGRGGPSADRSSSMIISRGGDTKNQLSSGTRIRVKLAEDLVVSSQSVPLIGYISSDVYSDSTLAIPKGSKLMGEASFNESTERASVNWRSVITPDGKERAFSALSVGQDSQEGIKGNVRSEAVKNSVGQTLTTFVGAYAAGSMNTGAFGANQGGPRNGLRNAIAATATNRANSLGEELQKESKWIELKGGSELTAILNQPFVFRDPGGTNG